MNKRKYNTLINCIEQRTREDGSKFYCKIDNTPEDIKEALNTILFNLDNGFDVPYEQLNDALNAFSDIKLEDMENYDPYENNEEYASVYTSERLSWLNNNTLGDIEDIQKEYQCDISTACAIWYDNTVKHIISEIVEYINNN